MDLEPGTKDQGRKRPDPLSRIRPQTSGRDDWIRTSDPLTPSQVRYQAAPHPDAGPDGPESILPRRSGYFDSTGCCPSSVGLGAWSVHGPSSICPAECSVEARTRDLGPRMTKGYALARFARLDAAADFPDPRLATCLAMTRDFGLASSERRGDLADAGGVNR